MEGDLEAGMEGLEKRCTVCSSDGADGQRLGQHFVGKTELADGTHAGVHRCGEVGLLQRHTWRYHLGGWPNLPVRSRGETERGGIRVLEPFQPSLFHSASELLPSLFHSTSGTLKYTRIYCIEKLLSVLRPLVNSVRTHAGPAPDMSLATPPLAEDDGHCVLLPNTPCNLNPC
eukprot:101818-Prorocentrum_minimum.AAC.1